MVEDGDVLLVLRRHRRLRRVAQKHERHDLPVVRDLEDPHELVAHPDRRRDAAATDPELAGRQKDVLQSAPGRDVRVDAFDVVGDLRDGDREDDGSQAQL